MTTVSPHPLNPITSCPPGVPDAVWSEYTELMARADRGQLTAHGYTRLNELHRAAPLLQGDAGRLVAGVCDGCGKHTGWGRHALVDQVSGPGREVLLCPGCDPETDHLPD